LRDVRRVFGAGNWDIEWADDGHCCWLVQVRPVTPPTRRNETYTRANFTEILPELPSRFMTSVIASCADDVFAYYRTHDRSLPTRRPLIDVFHGRPTFNLSLLTDMMRCWGLPTRLVTNSIGGVEGTPGGFRLGRLCRKAPVLLRFGLAQLRSVASSRRTIRRILAGTEKPGTSLTACIATLRWLYTAVVTDMLALTAAMSLPLLVLHLAGVLEEHNVRQQTVSTTMFAELDRLRVFVAQHPEWRAHLQQGRMPADDVIREAWGAFLTRHGHRGIYESDSARPRLWEAPEALLTSLTHPAGVRQRLPSRTILGWLTRPLWWQAGRTMRAREELRYHAMIGFDRMRQAFLDLAAHKVAEGALPAPDALWTLTIDEASQLDDHWRPAPDFFRQRLQEIERCRAVTLPDWFRRFDDLESPRQGGGDRLDTQRFTGVSLTSGVVEGQAWVLSEPRTDLPSGYEPAPTILVARSVDAGWIPTFVCVAGVVVEIGGDLSHGSIILREIGLPAITNVDKVTRGIRTGDALRLCATTGMVERVCDDTERHEERGAVNHVES
jgi:pyruvate,water dikinase